VYVSKIDQIQCTRIAVDRFFKLASSFDRFFKRPFLLDRLLIGGIEVKCPVLRSAVAPLRLATEGETQEVKNPIFQI